MRKRREFDSASFSVALDAATIAQLRRALAFFQAHSGEGHRVRNRVRGNRQTLYCTCGLPGSIALREEDLDYG